MSLRVKEVWRQTQTQVGEQERFADKKKGIYFRWIEKDIDGWKEGYTDIDTDIYR